ncbi:MAG: hypothetical protein MR894_03225, partial [Akkermansia muciniphila]|nr:hypothetical protein [Akkermansia muciniphila]
MFFARGDAVMSAAFFWPALFFGMMGSVLLLRGELLLGKELMRVGVSFDNSWIVWGRRCGISFLVSLVLFL